MHYRVLHRTAYQYEFPVTVGHYSTRLEPRQLPFQACPWHRLSITPEPTVRYSRSDAYGNLTAYFEIEGAHQEMEVLARSLIKVSALPPYDPMHTPAWETIREGLLHLGLSPLVASGGFAFASPLIVPSAAFHAYAVSSFPAGRPILQGVCELNERLHQDFTFDPAATDVATPVAKAFALRRGVCQDIAQVMIACLRSLGLPARYVSGYLETLPPPGQARLVGADASHAWVSVFCGEAFGWIDADPTNNLLPSDRHVTLAWGRDFLDVIPLRGVSLGSGRQHLTVSVDVEPVLDEET